MPDFAGPHGHILVFEDDEIFGHTVGTILRKAGFDVAVAAHFQSALELLGSDRPLDLLVTDIVVPDGINGLALSRMARMRRRDIKVIYMTGYEVPGADQEALGPILRKPVSDGQLMAEVMRALALT